MASSEILESESYKRCVLEREPIVNELAEIKTLSEVIGTPKTYDIISKLISATTELLAQRDAYVSVVGCEDLKRMNQDVLNKLKGIK